MSLLIADWRISVSLVLFILGLCLQLLIKQLRVDSSLRDPQHIIKTNFVQIDSELFPLAFVHFRLLRGVQDPLSGLG